MKQLQGLGELLLGGTVVLLAAQPVWAQVTQVTGVKLNPNRGGVEVMLETTTGDRPQIFAVNRRSAYVADITNTQLRLPQGNSFRQDNPAPGIASIELVQQEPNTVRLIVNGINNPPSGQVASRETQGIKLSFSPAAADVAASPAPRVPTPNNSPTVGQAPPVQAPAGQTPTAQAPPGRTPDVLVPNPQITIEGAPGVPGTLAPAPAAGAIQPNNPAPPFLPRAVAPPVGDIAISEVDATGTVIDLGTGDRIPRLLLRDAPVREVLGLLSRAAGRNVVFIGPQPGAAGQAQPTAPGQGQPAAAAGLETTISLDIENEPLQDVFNYVLRITGLEANRVGNTVFVGTRLPDIARNVVVRSLRLNQVPVTTAANFLTAQGAETQLPIEQVQIQTIGEGAAARTVETRTPTIIALRAQRGEGPLVLSGLSVLANERLNSITLVGDPRKVEIASAFLTQLDARRRQVAVNVKIIDVNLLNTDIANASLSFGIGESFFTFDNGAAAINFGGINPPAQAQVVGPGQLAPPVVPAVGTVFPTGVELEPFLDAQPNAPFGTGTPQQFGSPPLNRGNVQFPPRGTFPRPPFGTDRNVLQPGVTEIQPDNIEFGLPTLFRFPSRVLALLQAQITNGNAKILTDPTLVIQEGETATVNLGQEVITNIISEQTAGTGVPIVTTRVEKDIAGLRLQVQVNRIDDNGFITLAVNPTVTVPLPGGVPVGNTQITLLARRDLLSGQIRLRDGQTLILSGIIQDQDRTNVTKVPILGDIPILGALFRSTTRTNQRQEVIVLLTPQVIDDSAASPFGYRYRPSPAVRDVLQPRNTLPNPGNNR